MTNHTVTDTLTLLRRNLRHAVRYPSMTVGAIFGPVIVLLLFVGVLGKTLGTGLANSGGHPAHYIAYIAPGIIITAVASGSMATAVAVCVDTTEGIIDRFRAMPISRVAILAAHVINSVLSTIASTACVAVVSILLGFRPHATAAGWLAAAGLLLFLTLALTWLAVAMGLVSATPEAASNSPMLIVFLPFIGSAFAPASSMPAGVRQFAEYQPFTPTSAFSRGTSRRSSSSRSLRRLSPRVTPVRLLTNVLLDLRWDTKPGIASGGRSCDQVLRLTPITTATPRPGSGSTNSSLSACRPWRPARRPSRSLRPSHGPGRRQPPRCEDAVARTTAM